MLPSVTAKSPLPIASGKRRGIMPPLSVNLPSAKTDASKYGGGYAELLTAILSGRETSILGDRKRRIDDPLLWWQLPVQRNAGVRGADDFAWLRRPMQHKQIAIDVIRNRQNVC